MIEKCRIESSEASIKFECQFNPKEWSISKSNNYERCLQGASDSQKVLFKGGNSFTLNMKLTFDTAELDTDVHDEIKPLLDLTQIGNYTTTDENGKSVDQTRPPLCKVTWGALNFQWKSGKPFDNCFLDMADVNYTHFLLNGTPVRAEVQLNFTEASSKVGKQNPTSESEARRIWRVTDGETLDWIAFKEYGNPAMWRYIAEINNLSDPQQLQPGQLLKIVPLPHQR